MADRPLRRDSGINPMIAARNVVALLQNKSEPLRRLITKASIGHTAVAGLVIRLILAPFLGHPYDLRIFMAVGQAVANGLTPYGQYLLQSVFADMPHPHLYGLFYGIGYPPTWGLILGSCYKVFQAIFPHDIEAYTLVLKLPIIAGDLGAAFLLYRILKSEANVETASNVFRFYLLCPFVLVVGTVWGMFDTLVFLFSILSTYLVYRRPAWSAVSLGLASSLKPYAVILAPLYSIFIYRKTRSVSQAAKYTLLVMFSLGALTLVPMLLFEWPLSNLYYAMSAQVYPTDFYGAGTEYIYGAASPFNMFNILRLVSPSLSPPMLLNYLWIPACLATYVYAFTRETGTDFKSLVFNSFLCSLAFFTARSWVSEQNLLFLLFFFALTVLLSGTRRPWSLIHGTWILLFAFVLIHVPAPSFLWIVQPWIFNAMTSFCTGPYGWVRIVLMSVLTFSWLGILWRKSVLEWIKW